MTLSNGEIKNILIGIVNILDYAEHVSQLPGCNTCGSSRDCKHLPRMGQMQRINCPLWTDPNAPQTEAAHE